MPFTYNSGGKVTALSSDASIEFAFTAGAASKVIVLSLVNTTNAAAKVTSGTPTYDGNAMTKCGSTQLSAEGGTEMWYYLSPVAETAKAVVIPNAATSQAIRYCCIDFTDADYSASLFNSGGASDGSGADVACTIAGVPDGAAVVSCMLHGEKDEFASISVGTTLLETPSIDEGSCQSGIAYSIQSGTADETHTYVSGGTTDDFNWVMGAWEEVSPPSDVTAPAGAVTLATVGPAPIKEIRVPLNIPIQEETVYL